MEKEIYINKVELFLLSETGEKFKVDMDTSVQKIILSSVYNLYNKNPPLIAIETVSGGNNGGTLSVDSIDVIIDHIKRRSFQFNNVVSCDEILDILQFLKQCESESLSLIGIGYYNYIEGRPMIPEESSLMYEKGFMALPKSTLPEKAKEGEAVVCPVCNGKTHVPYGFYLPKGTTTKTTGQVEKCKSCDAKGYILPTIQATKQ